MTQPYQTMIDLVHEAEQAAGDQDRAVQIWNQLMDVAFSNFARPTSASWDQIDSPQSLQEISAMRLMFESKLDTVVEQLKKIPPVLAEQVFPVYVARYLLRGDLLSFDAVRHSRTGMEFHNRYRNMILRSLNWI